MSLTFAESLDKLATMANAPGVPDFYIVACTQQKRPYKAEARDLYCSPWFLKARAYVESTGKPWLILSAKHGLVEPAAEVEPYEQHISHWGGKRDREVWGERAMARLRGQVAPGQTVAVLAGKDYVDAIWKSLRLTHQVYVALPLEKMGIGQQMAWLKSAVPA